MKKINRFFLLISLLLLTPFQAVAHSKNVRDLVYDMPDDGATMEFEESQNKVYKAVKQGLIKPYSVLSKTVMENLNGRIINVELEEDDGVWLYELKILHNNDLIKAEYNASSLELTELKGRHLMSVIKK